jgi:hypothetical protein
MPAVHLVPDMDARTLIMVRNKVFGKRQVRDEAIIPTVKAFGFRDLDELRSVATARACRSSDPAAAERVEAGAFEQAV